MMTTTPTTNSARARRDSFTIQQEEDFDSFKESSYGTTFRHDLCYDEQISNYNTHKWRRQAEYLEERAKESEIPFQGRRIGMRLLVDEAHRLHQRSSSRSKHSSNSVNEQSEDPSLAARWQKIGKRAMQDLSTMGPQNVIRNLSCMCIFVDGRQAEVYGEHEMDRTRRVTQQCDVLNKLHMQRLQGQSACFLLS